MIMEIWHTHLNTKYQGCESQKVGNVRSVAACKVFICRKLEICMTGSANQEQGGQNAAWLRQQREGSGLKYDQGSQL
jgi:hypothetical protein